MNSANIYHINSIKQDRHDVKVTMQGIALTNLVHSIIREYGIYNDNSYSVDVRNLDMADKRLVVSHFESAESYEWACETFSRINEVFNEHASYLQRLIDEECDDIYREDMEEVRAYR